MSNKTIGRSEVPRAIPVVTANQEKAVEPTPEEIAAHAYVIWEHEGCPDGRDTDHWLQAEAQLRGSQAPN